MTLIPSKMNKDLNMWHVIETRFALINNLRRFVSGVGYKPRIQVECVANFITDRIVARLAPSHLFFLCIPKTSLRPPETHPFRRITRISRVHQERSIKWRRRFEGSEILANGEVTERENLRGHLEQPRHCFAAWLGDLRSLPKDTRVCIDAG